MPTCIAALANQDQKKICQNVYLIWPGKGLLPVPQIDQKSEKLSTFNWLNETMPAATNPKIIIGEIFFWLSLIVFRGIYIFIRERSEIKKN